MERAFQPLSKYVSLSSVCEVERGVDIAEVMRLREGQSVTWSQRSVEIVSIGCVLTKMSDSHLNRRRYAQNDETLYVAPEDERTDYVRLPCSAPAATHLTSQPVPAPYG